MTIPSIPSYQISELKNMTRKSQAISLVFTRVIPMIRNPLSSKWLSKSIFSTALISCIASPSMAVTKTTKCILISENQPGIDIAIQKIRTGLARGTINYFDEPKFSFATGVGNGFGLQYFHLGELQPAEPLELIRKIVASGRLVTFVGSQVARGTPSGQRIPGELKILLPSLPMSFFYSLDTKRFEMDEESKAMLNAFEGFFKGSGECDSKIFVYAWE